MKKSIGFIATMIGLAMALFVIIIAKALYESIKSSWSWEASLILALAIGTSIVYVAKAFSDKATGSSGSERQGKMIDGQAYYLPEPSQQTQMTTYQPQRQNSYQQFFGHNGDV